MNSRKIVLLVNIFLAGFVVIALEILGIRILASFFGYSIFVWGTVIGIVLASLSVGYFFGGILADKSPRFSTVYKVIFIALLYLAVSITAYPFLLESLSKWDLFAGLSLASIILLVPPSILLSMVSPIATKSLLKKQQEGKTIGNIYALSNLGSIIGVFATTFYFIPFFGSKATMIFCFVSSIVFVLIGFALEKTGKKKLFVFGIISLTLFASIFVFVKTPSRYLLHSTESVYNLIEIKQFNGTKWLLLNGYPMSYKEKEETLEMYFYDAMAVFPRIVSSEEILILGFASGTVSGKIETFFPEVKVVGVEIDPKVVQLSKEHFGLKESEKLKVFVDDARHYLQVNEKKHGIIFNNAINAKFIPFHLVSKEFFELSSKRLKKDGVLVNYSFYSKEKTLLRDSISRTMCEVFPDVYYLNFPLQQVSLLFGFKKKTTKEELIQRIDSAKPTTENEDAKELMDYFKEIKKFDCLQGQIITDDKNPIDQITLEQII